MEKVYLGFSTHKGNLLSWLIQKVTGAPYSHVYIRRVSKYGEYVYQASGLAVNFTNIDTFREKSITVEEYEFDLEDVNRDKVFKFFIKYVGRPYDWKALFKILAMMLARRVGWKLSLPTNGDAEFVCSELGELFCEDILGMDIPEEEDFISPKDLNPYVAKAGKKVV